MIYVLPGWQSLRFYFSSVSFLYYSHGLLVGNDAMIIYTLREILVTLLKCAVFVMTSFSTSTKKIAYTHELLFMHKDVQLGSDTAGIFRNVNYSFALP